MKNIIGVRFKKLGKIYFFNPKGIKVQKGDKVIVETSQGEEYAEVLIPNRYVEDDKLVSPLKKVGMTIKAVITTRMSTPSVMNTFFIVSIF